MSMEWPLISAFAAAGGFALSFATFWFTFGVRLSKAETEASAAAVTVAASGAVAKAENDRFNERLIILGTAFSNYREQVAKEYISREVAREMEDRLTVAIDRLGDRFERFFEAMARK